MRSGQRALRAAFSQSEGHHAIKLFSDVAEGRKLDPREINSAVASGALPQFIGATFHGAASWPRDDEGVPNPDQLREPYFFGAADELMAEYASGNLWLTEVLWELMELAAQGRLGTGRFRREALANALSGLRAIRSVLLSVILTSRGKAGRALLRKQTGGRSGRYAAAPLAVAWALRLSANPEADPVEVAEAVLADAALPAAA